MGAAARTEFELKAAVERGTSDGACGLSQQDFIDVVEGVADFLMDDHAAIDPVVYGRGDTGELEIVLGVEPPLSSVSAITESDGIVGRLIDHMGFAEVHNQASQSGTRDGITLVLRSKRLSVTDPKISTGRRSSRSRSSRQ